MLRLPESSDQFCPYREWLRIDHKGHRVSWFELLDVTVNATDGEIDRALRTRLRQLQSIRPNGHRELIESIGQQLRNAARILKSPADRRRYRKQLTYRRRFERIGDPQRGTRRNTVVTECYDHTLHRRVAIRRLRSVSGNRPLLGDFLDEARFFCAENYPHLPAIHHVDEPMGIIVMEFLEYSLLDYADGLTSPQERVRFAESVLQSGLAFLKSLHRDDRIHGGLGIRSFRVTTNGEVRLLQVPVVSEETIIPVPDSEQTCQAPEMLSPDTFGPLNHSSDLYMLGMLVIRLLAGGQLSVWIPAMGQSGVDIPRQCLKWHSSPMERLPALHELMPQIPGYFAETLAKMCEKRCSDRFAEATDVLQELENGRRSLRDHADGGTDLVPATGRQKSSNSAAVMPTQQKNVRVIGGPPPLLHGKLPVVHKAAAWHEVIQDPVLIWQCVKGSRGLQSGLAVLVIIVCVIYWEKPENMPQPELRDDISASAAMEADVAQSDFGMVNTEIQEVGDFGDSVESGVVDLERLNAYPTLVRLDSDEDLLEEEVLLPLPQPRPQPGRVASQPQPGRVTSQPWPVEGASQPQGFVRMMETVPSFPIVGLESAKQRDLVLQLLREMRQKPVLRSRMYELRRECQRLAPAEPRVPFIYAAAGGYSSADRSALRLAVQLSPVGYTQPFRKLTELRLRELSQNPQTADRILADMRVFCRQLATSSDGPERAFEWQWAGSVFGWMERSATHGGVLSIVAATTFQSLNSPISASRSAAFRQGRDLALAASQIDSVFPLLPEGDLVLALESFSEVRSLLIGTKTAAR